MYSLFYVGFNIDGSLYIFLRCLFWFSLWLEFLCLLKAVWQLIKHQTFPFQGLYFLADSEQNSLVSD